MIIIFILLSIIIGLVVGIVTGLMPGIHVNTIAALMVSISTFLYGFGMDSVSIAVFIAVVAITHAFFDYIPSVFLGVPNDEVFALLPGHRMVKEGRGLEAVNLSIQGSWKGVKIGVVVLIFLLLFGQNVLSVLDEGINPYLFWVLLIISLVLIISEDNKLGALFVFICSGLFGIVVLGSPLVPNRNSAFNGLFPALAGIFGVSGIILSLFEKESTIPPRKEPTEQLISKAEMNTSSFRGATAGMAVGLLPGLGAANAATLLLLIEDFIGKTKKKDTSGYAYIVTTSSINTTDTIFGIAALYFIEKSRSGASVAMAHLFEGTFQTYALIAIIFAIFTAAFLSAIIMKKYSMDIADFLSGMDYKALNFSILIFLSVLVYLTTGIWGLIIMVGGAFLGMIAPLTNVRRAQAMGFFLVPVILFYSGHQRIISTFSFTEAKVLPSAQVGIIEVVLYLIFSIMSALIIYFITKYINGRLK